LSQTNKLKCEVAPLVGKSLAKSSDAEGLAGGSANKKLNWFIISFSYSGKIPMQGNIRKVIFKRGARERLDVA
jgi:hypothetical protein